MNLRNKLDLKGSILQWSRSRDTIETGNRTTSSRDGRKEVTVVIIRHKSKYRY